MAVKGVRKVHPSYLECPTEEWVVADGGRCYKLAELRSSFLENVRCPDCISKERWFGSKDAFRQHWNAVHRKA